MGNRQLFFWRAHYQYGSLQKKWREPKTFRDVVMPDGASLFRSFLHEPPNRCKLVDFRE